MQSNTRMSGCESLQSQWNIFAHQKDYVEMSFFERNKPNIWQNDAIISTFPLQGKFSQLD